MAAYTAGLSLERALAVAFEQTVSFPGQGQTRTTLDLKARWSYRALRQFYERPLSVPYFAP